MEGSVKADVKCYDVQESFDEDPQPRRGEAPVGDSYQSGDPCPCDSVCPLHCRPDPCMFSDEGAYCCSALFLLVCLPPCTSPFHFLDTTYVPILCDSICRHSILSFRSCYSSLRYYLVFARSLAVTCVPPVVTCVSIRLCSCLFDTGTNSHIASLALWVYRWFPLVPNNKDGSPLQKQKQAQDIVRIPKLEIPTQMADRPPGFPVGLV
jgi:hypothetical protein